MFFLMPRNKYIIYTRISYTYIKRAILVSRDDLANGSNDFYENIRLGVFWVDKSFCHGLR